MQLYEQYRPKTWGDVLGQPKAIRQIETIRTRTGLAGQCFWITGKSGQGKTTIARLIAGETSSPFATAEIDGADLDLETIRDLENKSRGKPLGGGTWCLIVNEAHSMRSAILARLNTALENPLIQKNATIIFTTTKCGEKNLFDEEIEEIPFLSRCKRVALTDQGLMPVFAELSQRIATAENLNGQPIEVYQKLAKRCQNNMRAMLQSIENGDMIE
jgi:replication-associated recombination protein RarA